MTGGRLSTSPWSPLPFRTSETFLNAVFNKFRLHLPLSRLYARYVHGDLILNSCEGYGTDAIVYLKTKEAEAMELLPVYNKTSTKQYREAIQLKTHWVQIFS